MKYRLDGREKTLSMGVYPAVSVQQARKLRDDARSMVANGEDPSEAKQEQKRLKREANGQTFQQIGASFLEKQRKEGKSKATLDKTAYHLKLANRDFGNPTDASRLILSNCTTNFCFDKDRNRQQITTLKRIVRRKLTRV